MRLLVLLLLLANVGLFAWSRYAPQLASTESHLIAQQIHPEAIRLLTPLQLADAGERAGDARGTACLEWGAFSPGDVARAHAALEQLGPRVSERRVEDEAGWWVYMQPQGTRQAANEKVAELKRLGIDDYFMVQDDPRLRFAISLGVYRTEQGAKARLEQLRARGVRTAQVAPRTTSASRVFLQVRDIPEQAKAKLAELREAFPGTGLKDCPAP
jgi:hypothetical protein